MEFITNNALIVIALLLVALAGTIIYYSLQFGVAKEKDKQIARQVQQLKNEKIEINDNLAKAHRDYNKIKEEVNARDKEVYDVKQKLSLVNSKYEALEDDLNEAVSDKQNLRKSFDDFQDNAGRVETNLRKLIADTENDAVVYSNALNAVGDILEETLCAFDGTKVYKAFEYGATKKGEVIAKKDKRSFRKPVEIGYMFDNEFCSLENLVDKVLGDGDVPDADKS